MNIGIAVERIWEVNGLNIVKSFEIDENGKKIKDSTIYAVEDNDDFLEAFDTLAKARKFAREFY